MQQQDYTWLIIKELSGDITPDEATALKAWMSLSPENARTAEDIRRSWNSADHWQPQVNIDLDRDFEKITARINEPELTVVKRPNAFSTRQLLKVAASLALLLLAVWGMKSYQIFKQDVIQVAVQQEDKRRIDLPDGSRVWLRKGAQIAYNANLSTSNTREIALIGEAFFEVAHNPEKPFRITLNNGGHVEVLGTEFNVQAIPGQDEWSVLVQSGKVRFDPQPGQRGLILQKGQRGVFNLKTGKSVLLQPTTMNELAWQRDGLSFVSTPLAAVIQDMEKYYGCKIRLDNQAVTNCPYTAPLVNQRVETAIQTLAASFDLQMTRNEEGVFVLKGGVCKE